MKINDNIYSVEEIKDKVLIELINSKPIQRLKGIKQAGITGHILEDRDCTRYDHSVGVMVLLRKKQASLEEQIAGLLHDVSHTAFSHVVDFVYKTKEHNYHELFYEKIIRNSEIPSILKKHGFNLNRLSNENNFHLLEREIPDLCADRIDYALRDLNGFYTNGKLDNFIRSLVNINNEFVFSDFETAKEFAFNFINLDEKIWANIIEVTYFQIAADAIKIALENNILKEEDLFEEDNYVMDILKNSNNPKIKEKLSQLTPNLKVINSPENYDFYSKTKTRYVDPKFIEDGQLKRLSDVDNLFKQKLKEHKSLISNGYYIKIVSY